MNEGLRKKGDFYKKPEKYIHEDEVQYGDYSGIYPEKMMRTLRAKRIIHPQGAIKHDEIIFGTLEMDVGAEYPPRHHAPELYYVLEGEAECLFGDEHFIVRKGTVIQTAPSEVHSFKNIGSQKFVAVAFWWAPNGDTERINGKLELLPK